MTRLSPTSSRVALATKCGVPREGMHYAGTLGTAVVLEGPFYDHYDVKSSPDCIRLACSTS